MTSGRHVQTWTGLALFSYGFRPFFLLGALWAAIAMVLWVYMLAGYSPLATRFDPTSWHAHEFLFGYLGAVMAGFLLTAVPNWTGRAPTMGWPLVVLVGLWLLGRLAIGLSLYIPMMIVAIVDLAFPMVLGGTILREIIAGKNWRNLIVLALLAGFTLANLIFHIEAAVDDYPAQGIGFRSGLAASLMMIGLIGGRIIPSFTRNWLAKAGYVARPTPPMQRFDQVVLLVTLAGLITWVFAADHILTGLFLLLLAGLHFLRQIRWKGHLTVSDPLILILHVAYGFFPLGALIAGLAILMPDIFNKAASQHIWMAGAIGLMTLAVMTRATLGHTGQALRAGAGTTALYLAIVAAVITRLMADFFPAHAMEFYQASAALWIAAFTGFALIFGGPLLRKRTRQS